MISKKHRFHGHSSLNYTYRHGRTAREKYIGLKYANNPKRPDWRLAVVVSKKVDPSAVVRNRIRRRLFEQMRLQLPAKLSHTDMILTVYDNRVASMEPTELQEMVASIVKEITNGAKS